MGDETGLWFIDMDLPLPKPSPTENHLGSLGSSTSLHSARGGAQGAYPSSINLSDSILQELVAVESSQLLTVPYCMWPNSWSST